MQAAARARLQLALTALADGERAAFDEVFTLAWPVLLSIATRLLGADEADDVAQRALLKLFSHASRFEPERDALPWIVTFVLNEVRTVRNQRRRRARPVPPPGSAGGDPEAALLTVELHDAVQRVLGTLSARDREALGFARAEDGEVAPAPATIRKRRQRAMLRLKMAWKRIHGLA